jgi:hypothetical protein
MGLFEIGTAIRPDLLPSFGSADLIRRLGVKLSRQSIGRRSRQALEGD